MAKVKTAKADDNNEPEKPKKVDRTPDVLQAIWNSVGEKFDYDKVSCVNVFDNNYRVNFYANRVGSYGHKMFKSFFVRLGLESVVTQD